MFKAGIRALLIGFAFLPAIVAGPEEKPVFAARRAALMKRVEGSIAVLVGAPAPRAYVAFRQENSFYYLTGVETPGAFLMIDGVRHRSILFLPERDRDEERWEGPRLFADDKARKATGIDEVLPVSRFSPELEKRGKLVNRLYTPLSPDETAAESRDRSSEYESARREDPWDGRIGRAAAFEKSLKEKLPRIAIEDLSPVLDDMRRVKDEDEIGRLRKAGRIAASGLREAIRSAKPGMYEYQLAALAEFAFSWRGAAGFGFFPIVGSGPNSVYMHYSRNDRRIEPPDIVVMDFGPDYRYYGADATRTFPASGRFSEEQARVYRIVLEAHKAALENARPGGTFEDMQQAVMEVLERYHCSENLLHGVCHYVGMAIHDVGKARPFEPGVVIAVEPGVYFPDRQLGVRIEDTVLITRDGHEVLTAEAPVEISEIESLMAESGMVDASGIATIER